MVGWFMEIWDLISDGYVLRIVLRGGRVNVAAWLICFSIACFVSLINLHIKAWIFIRPLRDRREEMALELEVHQREVEIDEDEL